MGNIVTKLKRFLSNKNTVTILCVIAGLLVLYIGYNWRVNVAINPQTIPYAKNTLSSRHVITADDIGYIEVSNSVVSRSTNMIKSSGLIIGKEVMYGTTIPQNSFFYNEAITSPENQPDYPYTDMEAGYTLFSLSVDIHTTYGNSIYPGNYIDLWFKGVDDYNKLMYTKLIQSIQVLDVRDGQGKSVFETSSENRTPSELLFAVPDDMYSLLRKAQYISGVEIIPVPRNKSYTANPGETEVASGYVRSYIESKAAIIPDEQIGTSTNSNNSNSNNNNNNNNNDEDEDTNNNNED